MYDNRAMMEILMKSEPMTAEHEHMTGVLDLELCSSWKLSALSLERPFLDKMRCCIVVCK